jgi:hypothetical protein
MIFKKTILVLALLTSAVTVSFANAPGGDYIQCDPRNRIHRSDVRQTVGRPAVSAAAIKRLIC